jgi:hydroxyacid-oxoacid transhydrogenase
MGVDVAGAKDEDAGDLLAGAVIDVMKKTGMPNGLKAVGFEVRDIEDLVAGTLPQHRVTKLSPRPASPEDLVKLFQETMTIW